MSVRARWGFLLAASVGLAACGDGESSEAPGDDAGAGDDQTSACLDRPGELPRPPEGRLPCELIPPGLTLDP